MNRDIQDMRQRYELDSLSEQEVNKDPFVQFKTWFHQVLETEEIEPNAMSVATVSELGKPSCRTVLLKEYSEEGFIFYTNYESKKGQEIAANQNVAILFWWKLLQRQVRIEGVVKKISKEHAQKYFESRPKGSQIGATISPQSKVVTKEQLESSYEETDLKFKNQSLELPENWGGYIVKPNLYEFWQGRPSRLHDRIQYRLVEGDWLIERIAP